MAKYLFKASLSPEGAKGVIKDGGSARRAATTKMVESVGGKMEAFYFAFGETDAYLIVDAPDNVAAAAIAMTVSASGSVATETVVLITPEEVDRAVKMKVAFTRRGPEREGSLRLLHDERLHGVSDRTRGVEEFALRQTYSLVVDVGPRAHRDPFRCWIAVKVNRQVSVDEQPTRGQHPTQSVPEVRHRGDALQRRGLFPGDERHGESHPHRRWARLVEVALHEPGLDRPSVKPLPPRSRASRRERSPQVAGADPGADAPGRGCRRHGCAALKRAPLPLLRPP